MKTDTPLSPLVSPEHWGMFVFRKEMGFLQSKGKHHHEGQAPKHNSGQQPRMLHWCTGIKDPKFLLFPSASDSATLGFCLLLYSTRRLHRLPS